MTARDLFGFWFRAGVMLGVGWVLNHLLGWASLNGTFLTTVLIIAALDTTVSVVRKCAAALRRDLGRTRADPTPPREGTSTQ